MKVLKFTRKEIDAFWQSDTDYRRTGQQGTAAAAALLRRGWKVGVLTRDSSSVKADAVRTMGADVFTILTRASIGR